MRKGWLDKGNERMIYNTERPRTFDQIKGQALVVENIRNQSKRDQFFPVFILCGQYGSGKTTMARIIAMAANCEHKDEQGNPCGICESCQAVLSHSSDGILEIDGASNNGVEDVRRLISQASTLGFFKKKIIVIDEAHMLTKNAFNALLITLENPPSHCIFILCTTDKEALPNTVISRAPVYTFGKIADRVIQEHILEVAKRNGIPVTPDAAGLLARYADGAMRNALQMLEQMSLQKKGEEITEQDVVSVLGLSSAEQRCKFLEACLSGDVKSLCETLQICEQQGIALKAFTGDALAMATDLLLYMTGNQVVGSTGYLKNLQRLSAYGERETGKLCRLLSQMAGYAAKTISKERLVIDALAVFRQKSQGREEEITQCKDALPEPKKETALNPAMSKEPASSKEKEPDIRNDDQKEQTSLEHASTENPFGLGFQSLLNIGDFGGFGGFGTSEPKKGKGRAVSKAQAGPALTELFDASISTSDLVSEQKEAAGENKEAPREGPEAMHVQEEIWQKSEDKEAAWPSRASEDIFLEGVNEEDIEKASDENADEGTISWEEMAGKGLMPAQVNIPAADAEEEIEQRLKSREESLLSVAESLPCADEGEEELPLTREDLNEANQELERLLKNPGFKMIFQNAKVVTKDFQIFLVYEQRRFFVASEAFTMKKKGIHSVMEGKL